MADITKARQALERNRYNRSALTLQVRKVHYEGSLDYLPCGRKMTALATTTRRPSEVTCRDCYPLATGNPWPGDKPEHELLSDIIARTIPGSAK